ADRQRAQRLFLVVRPVDDVQKRLRELQLVVDQRLERGQRADADELAHVPKVLGEDVEIALRRQAAVEARVLRRRLLELRLADAARADLDLAAVGERAQLYEQAVAVLQRGDDGARVVAGEEMPAQRVERPADVAREERLR